MTTSEQEDLRNTVLLFAFGVLATAAVSELATPLWGVVFGAVVVAAKYIESPGVFWP